MNRKVAIFWIPPGFIIVIIDAWLSIQSMAGIMHAVNIMGYVLAVIVGISLTTFSVFYPILKKDKPSLLLLASWTFLMAADIGTSVVGAIWYVQLGNPLTKPVNLALLSFEPANFLTTLGYVLSVLVIAWCCVMFGKALNALRRPDHVDGDRDSEYLVDDNRERRP
jgi:hypothetical protein